MLLVRSFRSTLGLIAVVGLATLVGACGDSPTSPTASPAYSQTDLRLGTGAEAVSGKVVTVHYTGWLDNAAQADQKGAQFDSSAGLTPFTFTLGTGTVISGWDKGLVGMKVGGFRRLVIPPSLGYGSTRAGAIPPNSTLLFEVELISVQ